MLSADPNILIYPGLFPTAYYQSPFSYAEGVELTLDIRIALQTFYAAFQIFHKAVCDNRLEMPLLFMRGESVSGIGGLYKILVNLYFMLKAFIDHYNLLTLIQERQSTYSQHELTQYSNVRLAFEQRMSAYCPHYNYADFWDTYARDIVSLLLVLDKQNEAYQGHKAGMEHFRAEQAKGRAP